jgi:hypothetical protein
VNPNGDRRDALPGLFTDGYRSHPQRCMDCDDDVADEYYVLRHDLWHQAVGHPHGFLCVPCLETRLGRRLAPDDFPPCGANDLRWRKTDRLRDRLRVTGT